MDRALDLLIDGASGIWHVANQGALSWLELAKTAAVAANLDPDAVESCQRAVSRLPALRPRYSALGSDRGPLLPPIEDRWRDTSAIASRSATRRDALMAALECSLTNGHVDVVVAMSEGLRISRYGFVGGVNLMAEASGRRTETPLGPWQPLGGHRLWVAPESIPGL